MKRVAALYNFRQSLDNPTVAGAVAKISELRGTPIHQAQYTQWELGRVTPHKSTKMLIEVASGGAIKVADWDVMVEDGHNGKYKRLVRFDKTRAQMVEQRPGKPTWVEIDGYFMAAHPGDKDSSIYIEQKQPGNNWEAVVETFDGETMNLGLKGTPIEVRTAVEAMWPRIPKI